ncbi:hypothetical protein ACFXJ8_23100 [Nonomuraea sp. NPDC059194]|uniref:hypothetical protein n=1 Tax=Nonomuraea sp. NPDC059194 TaxID=3346764 RepID=UPI0036BB241E
MDPTLSEADEIEMRGPGRMRRRPVVVKRRESFQRARAWPGARDRGGPSGSAGRARVRGV